MPSSVVKALAVTLFVYLCSAVRHAMGWLRAVASSVRWRIKMSKAAGPSQAMFARAMKDHASRPYSVTTSDRFVCSTSEQAPTMTVGGGKATEESVISQGVFFLFLFYPSALSKYATTLNLNTLLNDMANVEYKCILN